MNKKEKIIAEFIKEMLKATPDDYLEIKLILMAHSEEKPALSTFLEKTFELVEEHRPLMIEMKGGTA